MKRMRKKQVVRGLAREAARVLLRWALPLLSAGLRLPGTRSPGLPIHVGSRGKEIAQRDLFLPHHSKHHLGVWDAGEGSEVLMTPPPSSPSLLSVCL